MASLWRVKDSRTGKEWGHVTQERIISWIQKGLLQGTDLVCPEGERSWRPATEVAEIRAALDGTPVKPPVVEEPMAAPPRPAPAPLPPSAPAIAEPEPQRRPKVQERPRPETPTRLFRPRRFAPGDSADIGEEPEMDLTPMIDCTFQLLIFFMVTATIAHPTTVLTPEAEKGVGIPTENKILICITRDEGGKYATFFQDDERKSFSLDNLADELGKMLENKDMRDVIIKADGAVDFGVVQKVMDTVSSFNAGRLLIGVREKR